MVIKTSLALMVVEILFCVDFTNLSVTKLDGKKIAADSRFPAPKISTHGISLIDFYNLYLGSK